MNIKKTIIFVITILAQVSALAQNEKPGHINYYKTISAETKELKIEIIDPIARFDFSKFKLKLTNLTLDYLIYKPKESIFKLEAGDFTPVDKKVTLNPTP